VASHVILVKPNDVTAVERVLSERNDVAAVIMEPIGASSGAVPTPPQVLRQLREITRHHRVLLVFDEVVTGFRIAPGGAQGLYGVKPDLTTLAKIVAGGMPGGAVAGRADVLAALDFAATAAAGAEKIQHPGTFNANPVSAAAGIAALDVIASTDACDRANASAAMLRQGFNEVLEELGVPPDRPMLEVLNKIDLLEPGQRAGLLGRKGEVIAASALTGEGVAALLEAFETAVTRGNITLTLKLDAADGSDLAFAYRHAQVLERRDRGGKINLSLRVHPDDLGRFESRFPKKIVL